MQTGSAALCLAGIGHCICVIRCGAEFAPPDDPPPILARRSLRSPSSGGFVIWDLRRLRLLSYDKWTTDYGADTVRLYSQSYNLNEMLSAPPPRDSNSSAAGVAVETFERPAPREVYLSTLQRRYSGVRKSADFNMRLGRVAGYFYGVNNCAVQSSVILVLELGTGSEATRRLRSPLLAQTLAQSRDEIQGLLPENANWSCDSSGGVLDDFEADTRADRPLTRNRLSTVQLTRTRALPGRVEPAKSYSASSGLWLCLIYWRPQPPRPPVITHHPREKSSIVQRVVNVTIWSKVVLTSGYGQGRVTNEYSEEGHENENAERMRPAKLDKLYWA
ncbi:hypothetical protein BDV93DRAFT_512367 [Ceratobasidium sp. AG-I]|nr:hypothetical protein BDV93DRAFT_512367 [Ceratobasidium sp. AG-I]